MQLQYGPIGVYFYESAFKMEDRAIERLTDKCGMEKLLGAYQAAWERYEGRR